MQLNNKKYTNSDHPEFTPLNEFHKQQAEKHFAKLVQVKDWSIKIYRAQWQKEFKELTPSQRCIMVSLKLYSGSDDRAWPSYQTLAKELNISDTKVWRDIQILKNKKLIFQKSHSGFVSIFSFKEIPVPIPLEKEKTNISKKLKTILNSSSLKSNFLPVP